MRQFQKHEISVDLCEYINKMPMWIEVIYSKFI